MKQLVHLVARVHLRRDRKPVEKVEDLANLRKITEWKFGIGEPRQLGDDPEPLTDYQDVRC